MPKSKSDTSVSATNAGDLSLDSPWRKWGPYLSDRQWGTVREDYSSDGNAWDSFPHDHARSRAYRWGEDGIGGLCDDRQLLCLAPAFWNGHDPIIKERLFGLTNGEGNHGEDVKEHYYHLDGTPDHAYMSMLYKYPHRAFPYARLVEENRRRGLIQPEFELEDTGVFDNNAYFDIQIEHAKADPEDLLMRITATNRGDRAARLYVVPQLWFRNTWSWAPGSVKPALEWLSHGQAIVNHPELGQRRCWVDASSELVLCENETNVSRLYGHTLPGTFKDGINDYLVLDRENAVRREGQGTKAGFVCVLDIPPGESRAVRVRLAASDIPKPFVGFDAVVDTRKAEADTFYASVTHAGTDPESAMIHRRALAGMLWTKQYFEYDIPRWLSGDPGQPAPPDARRRGRNREWEHLNNAEILSMPDGWEYPWYAAWDLAFHCVPLARIDPEFAKGQLVLLTREWYMHPNGQLPAYEWAFGDVNPPVHAWATWKVFEIDRKRRGDEGDLAFLERVFHKLMLNFTWWVNRKDTDGRNIFQGGFLGLDNIGVFDRSAPLPTGGRIDQADGTSWMAMYSLNLMRIALELARHNHVYEDIATKFFEHFLHIAEAMNSAGCQGRGLWDEDDQFFYDVLHTADGQTMPLRLRTMVGLIPLFAVEVIDASLLDELPEFSRRLRWYLKYRPELASLVSRWENPGHGGRRLFSLLRAHRMSRIVQRLLDETEFLSPHGVRALSRRHLDEPYELRLNERSYSVRYTPGESDTGVFGGNSNWRGPVWFPVNYLLIESLRTFGTFYGSTLTFECPTGSGRMVTLDEAASEISRRLISIFRVGQDGRRPVYAHSEFLATHPDFRDHLLFYEYFHGDSGRGVGASHQTGWTGLVAELIHSLDPGTSRAPETKHPLAASSS